MTLFEACQRKKIALDHLNKYANLKVYGTLHFAG